MKTLTTTTKSATRAVQKYSGHAMNERAEQLRERAAADGHGSRWIKNRLGDLRRVLDRIEAAGDIESITISVEWARSRTWGMNPTATVDIRTAGTFESHKGSASGYGYDKESAAVADALNQSPAIKRLLIVAASRLEKLPYGASVNEYHAGFSGGVGIDCFQDIFEACGFVWERTGSGRTFDAYTVRRK